MNRENGPDFRVILITSGPDPRPLLERAAHLTGMPIGVMLRRPAADTEAGSGVVQEMITLLQRSNLPENVIPIVNLSDPDVSVPDGWWSHLPARVLRTGFRSSGPFGAAAHSPPELSSAEGSGARYATLSPVYPTPSKPGNPGLGVKRFAELSEGVSVPLIALGGVDSPERVREVLRAGAYGFASIRAGTGAYRERLNEMLAIVKEETVGGNHRMGEHP